jgi:hypothetical protein
MTTPTSRRADDEFWEVALEVCWRHYLGEPAFVLSVPPEEAESASASVNEDGAGLTAAGGWCAPFDPDRGVEFDLAIPRLACGCPETVLETGTHEPGCTVLDIPATVEEATP